MVNNEHYYKDMCLRAAAMFEKHHDDVKIETYIDPMDYGLKVVMSKKYLHISRVIPNEQLDRYNLETWYDEIFTPMYGEIVKDIACGKFVFKNKHGKVLMGINNPAVIHRDAFAIKKVIFNGKATIVYWEDGTKTVVKLQGLEWYDPEKGLAMAIAKKALGNKGNYYDIFKKWLPAEYFAMVEEEPIAVRADRMKEIARESRENSNFSNEKEEEDMTRTMRMNVVSLYNEGKMTHEIAEICNLTESEVVRILENEGVLR